MTSDLNDILHDCYKDTALWCKLIFPDRFWRPFSPMHRELFKILDDDSIQKAVVAAPRGIGKTSIFDMAYPAKQLAYRNKHLIVPVSSTATFSQGQSEEIKEEILYNDRLRKIFKPEKSSSFSKEQWIVDFFDEETGKIVHRTKVWPKGSGQQVRGLNFMGNRPDLIVVDDLEDDESVLNEESRRKLKDWFFSSLMNTVDRGGKNWRILVIGTVLHEDSLLVNLLEDPSWYSVRLELCDDNYNSTWPDFMTTEEIIELKNDFDRQGLLGRFYREYRNLPIAGEELSFRPEHFQPYNEPQDILQAIGDGSLESVVIVDPAKTANARSAETAIICWGIDLFSNKMYVRDLVSGKFHPEEIYDHVCNMVQHYNARVLGVEANSLEDFIMNPLKQELSRRRINVEVMTLPPRGKKEERAGKLVYYYREMLVYHNKRVSGPLEKQMLSFPRPRRWDCLDAAAYIVQMMEVGGRYFKPPSWQEQEKLGVDRYVQERKALQQLYKGNMPNCLKQSRTYNWAGCP